MAAFFEWLFNTKPGIIVFILFGMALCLSIAVILERGTRKRFGSHDADEEPSLKTIWEGKDGRVFARRISGAAGAPDAVKASEAEKNKPDGTMRVPGSGTAADRINVIGEVATEPEPALDDLIADLRRELDEWDPELDDESELLTERNNQ